MPGLIFERPRLTSERPELTTERPGLASERPGLASGGARLAFAGPGLAGKEPRGEQTDGWTYRFPLYSTGLCPLWFPPGSLPCLLNGHHLEITKQDKGTNDQFMPSGEWF